MSELPRPKGEITRRHILDTALKLFRRRGFDKTTMRDIAQESELSLGAAYHYFPSKEALVQAYYEWMQGEHERLCEQATAPGADLATKIRTLLETKLELLRKDRKVLAALFAGLGDPSHPLSMFGKETAAVRERSVAQFTAIVDDAGFSEEMRALLGRSLWLAHLGIFLFFIHDKSQNQARTQALVDKLVDLVALGVPLLGHPLAEPIRCQLLDLSDVLGLGRQP
jgi:AcrR family transcriptional regulator